MKRKHIDYIIYQDEQIAPITNADIALDHQQQVTLERSKQLRGSVGESQLNWPYMRGEKLPPRVPQVMTPRIWERAIEMHVAKDNVGFDFFAHMRGEA